MQVTSTLVTLIIKIDDKLLKMIDSVKTYVKFISDKLVAQTIPNPLRTKLYKWLKLSIWKHCFFPKRSCIIYQNQLLTNNLRKKQNNDLFFLKPIKIDSYCVINI